MQFRRFSVAALFQAVALMHVQAQEAAVSPSGVVSITRGVASDMLTDEVIGQDGSTCDFAGTIVFAGTFSLEQGDKFFAIGSRQLIAYQLMVDYTNRFRCGIKLTSGNYAIELRSYDDQSSTDWTVAIARKLVSSNVDVLLGGYSSTLTAPLAEIAHENGKVLMAPGAALDSIFARRDKTFGTLPPTAKYLAKAIEGLSKMGAKTLATVYEDASFTEGVCAAAPDLAAIFGLTLTSTQNVTLSPNTTVLEPVAQKLAEENPDVVVTCVYDCVSWMQAMRSVNWSPKAQVFTVCVGQQNFADEVGTDAEYIMGVTPWDVSLSTEDAVTGWSAKDFADSFRQETSDEDVTYQAASAASVISITVQAIESADTTNGTIIAEHIASSVFKTIYGEISFDLNGQSQAPALLVQYDINGNVQTVFPEETSSGPILYPMPSWDRRDCVRLSECDTLGDTCGDEGQCVCSDANYYAVGAGETARCIPKEDLNYILPAIVAVGYVFVAMILFIAFFSLGWIYYNRNNTLVNVAQPMFLCLIIAGSVISILSIIPMIAETGYRDSDDIKKVDAACMAIPWLWGLGFSITFSALFAKVWRVKKLYKASTAMRHEHVGVKDALFIMVVMVAVETCILLAFQLVSPHHWEREVLNDIDGYSVESVGQCTSDSGWWFFLALVAFNVFCLFYALVLCFQTKDIPSDFAESNYIFLSVMFMFQVLVLAVPVSSMVRDEPDVFFFIRAGAIFLQNFTVLVIIFGPKMLRIYKGEDTKVTVKASMRESIRIQSHRRSSEIGSQINDASLVSYAGHGSSRMESSMHDFNASFRSHPVSTDLAMSRHSVIRPKAQEEGGCLTQYDYDESILENAMEEGEESSSFPSVSIVPTKDAEPEEEVSPLSVRIDMDGSISIFEHDENERCD
jgi:branched-chain amino acid transport system substrate-binding protein